MSFAPLMFSNWWEDLKRPHHLLDQDFGLGLHADQLITPGRLDLYHPYHGRGINAVNYIRPWAELLRSGDKGGLSTVEADKDKFLVTLDVQQFKPEEIDVKVVDGCVVVNGKHDEKQDEHGWIARQFTRKYLVPEQCDINQLVSKLSSDGVLTIMAPRKQQPQHKNEKIINVVLTGKPAFKSKESEESTKESAKK
ncbi:PREDICTED: protein lethal(2)essential for life-like [Ceratosolen solmsi marchali]|uniref:Protein lethal(2)essential for life-like n=1 Tax=Ceratosolen solmsi marchali TaxID=326594 RepID=A0AAJ6YLZ7_9HYME|nr:PREDICTED: protein lethal(2)essential for life-like [Ceratosolen solmsi marchali]